jgi:hypothetical protein
MDSTLINMENLVLKSKDVVGDWESLIYEGDGYYNDEFQSLTFDSNGVEILIGFEITIRGNHWYKPASYMEPEDGEVNITDVDINVNAFLIDDSDVEFDSDMKKKLTNIVKNQLKININKNV